MKEKCDCTHCEACRLPDDNKKYIFYLIYYFFSMAGIVLKKDQFTSFAIFMYASPLIIDLWTLNVTYTILKIFKYFFIGLNVLIVLCGVFGFFGFFSDGGAYFAFDSNAVLLAGVRIQKKIIAWAMAADLIVPIFFYCGSPTKSQRRTLSDLSAIQKTINQ